MPESDDLTTFLQFVQKTKDELDRWGKEFEGIGELLGRESRYLAFTFQVVEKKVVNTINDHRRR